MFVVGCDKIVSESIDKLRLKGTEGLVDIVKKGMDSERIIVAWHDYFLTTSNPQLPADATEDDRNEDTVYNSKNPTYRHPSATDLRSILNDPRALHNQYCSSINVQSRHKHCAYCDKNASKREKLRLQIEQSKKASNKDKQSRRKKRLMDPKDIPVKCRFDYPKQINSETHVYIKQVPTKDHHLKVCMKIASNRNDRWLNSHMRSIMEVSNPLFHLFFNSL